MHFRQRLKALKWVQLPQQCQFKLLFLFQTPSFRHLYFMEHFIRLSLSFRHKFGFKWTHLLLLCGHPPFGALVIQIYLLILAWSPLLCLLNCVIQISQRSLPWRPLPSVPWTIDGTVENQTLYTRNENI